ncbi:MAG: NfeD family protein [Myxococcota bacterium]|nr:NfeD family protein [Myxococcota bacterium]
MSEPSEATHDEREPTHAVFVRYLGFQIPGTFVAAMVLLLLLHWEHISTGLAWVLFGFWVLKDVCMFPFVRVGYEKGGGAHGASALLGQTGTVQRESLGYGYQGWVRVGPELWRARLGTEGDPVPTGGRVRVQAVEGLVLVVEREQP